MRFIKNSIQSWSFVTGAADSYGDQIPDGTTYNASTIIWGAAATNPYQLGVYQCFPRGTAVRSSARTPTDRWVRSGCEQACFAEGFVGAGLDRAFCPLELKLRGGPINGDRLLTRHFRPTKTMRTKLPVLCLITAGVLGGCGQTSGTGANVLPDVHHGGVLVALTDKEAYVELLNGDRKKKVRDLRHNDHRVPA